MLQPDKLRDGLVALFRDPGDGVSGPAAKWVNAYAFYSARAQAGPLFRDVTLDEARKKSMRAFLEIAFRRTYPERVVDEAAQDLQTAISAFWLTPPMLFTPIPTPATAGILSVVPPSLAGLLLPVLKSNVVLKGSDGSRAAARALASTIDAWTRTIVVAVTVTPPGPPPVPTPLT
jgi:hypothetical protein